MIILIITIVVQVGAVTRKSFEALDVTFRQKSLNLRFRGSKSQTLLMRGQQSSFNRSSKPVDLSPLDLPPFPLVSPLSTLKLLKKESLSKTFLLNYYKQNFWCTVYVVLPYSLQVPGSQVSHQFPGSQDSPQVPGSKVNPQVPGSHVSPQVPGQPLGPRFPGQPLGPRLAPRSQVQTQLYCI